MNFNLELPPHSYFVSSPEDHQHTKFHGRMMTGASYASTSEDLKVCHLGTVEGRRLKRMVSRSPSMAWPPY
jgi:hypothetical protein